jgi:putative membrane protein
MLRDIKTSRAQLAALTIAWIGGLTLSGLAPFDRATWWMEVAPVFAVLPVLWLTRDSLPLSRLAILVIGLHGLALMLGGAYTYARVPIGYDVQQWLGLSRNPYDRFGHFLQGFTPAIVFREILIRLAKIPRGMLLRSLVLACCLAVSAAYELLEFGAAMALGQGADEFLGTQGDPWDTQWDMLMCLVGAISALALLARLHDREIARVSETRRD